MSNEVTEKFKWSFHLFGFPKVLGTCFSSAKSSSTHRNDTKSDPEDNKLDNKVVEKTAPINWDPGSNNQPISFVVVGKS